MNLVLSVVVMLVALATGRQSPEKSMATREAMAVTITDTLWLAKTPVPVTTTLFGNPGKIAYLNVHANETTSVAAAKEYLKDKNGIMVKLDHDTTRLVKFLYNNRVYQFDPNRMFTQKGRIANLKLLNRKAPEGAEKIIAAFAEAVLQKLGDAGIIVAMHNNTDGKPLSINSFKERYVNPDMDTDDFILTTEKKIYNRLRQENMNTVWQTQSTSSDDGSLAIYCSKNKITYINIEAQQGHFTQQLGMLNALSVIFEQYNQ